MTASERGGGVISNTTEPGNYLVTQNPDPPAITNDRSLAGFRNADPEGSLF